MTPAEMTPNIDSAPLSTKHIRQRQATFSALHAICTVLMELAVAFCAGLALTLMLAFAGVPGRWPVTETAWLTGGAIAGAFVLWALARHFSSRLRAYGPTSIEVSIALARARRDHEKVARYIDAFAPQLRPLTQLEAQMLLRYGNAQNVGNILNRMNGR